MPAVARNPAIADSGVEARTAMSYYLAEVCQDPPPSLAMAPFFDELEAKAASTSWLGALQAMPADWWHEIGPIATPDNAAAYLTSMSDAGADAIAIFANPEDTINDARAFAETVFPQIKNARG